MAHKRLLDIFGNPRILVLRNPWEGVWPTKKKWFPRAPPYWVGKKHNGSPAQEAWKEHFTGVVRNAYSNYEATGRRADQKVVIENIASSLRDKTAAEVKPDVRISEIIKLAMRVPKVSKISGMHPIARKAEKLGVTLDQLREIRRRLEAGEPVMEYIKTLGGR